MQRLGTLPLFWKKPYCPCLDHFNVFIIWSDVIQLQLREYFSVSGSFDVKHTNEVH